MSTLTTSQRAILFALDGRELKKASLTDLRRETGLTQRGVRQVAYRLEEESVVAIVGREVRLTFAGMQALADLALHPSPAVAKAMERYWRKRTAAYPGDAAYPEGAA